MEFGVTKKAFSTLQGDEYNCSALIYAAIQSFEDWSLEVHSTD